MNGIKYLFGAVSTTQILKNYFAIQSANIGIASGLARICANGVDAGPYIAGFKDIVPCSGMMQMLIDSLSFSLGNEKFALGFLVWTGVDFRVVGCELDSGGIGASYSTTYVPVTGTFTLAGGKAGAISTGDKVYIEAAILPPVEPINAAQYTRVVTKLWVNSVFIDRAVGTIANSPIVKFAYPCVVVKYVSSVNTYVEFDSVDFNPGSEGRQ